MILPLTNQELSDIEYDAKRIFGVSIVEGLCFGIAITKDQLVKFNVFVITSAGNA
jgi:hypothetical protein